MLGLSSGAKDAPATVRPGCNMHYTIPCEKMQIKPGVPRPLFLDISILHGIITTGGLLYHQISMHLLLAARKAAGNRKSYARCTIYASRSRYNNHRVVIIPPDFNASFARRPQSGRQPQKLCTLYHLRFAFTVQQPQGGYYTTGFQCIFCSPPAKRNLCTSHRRPRRLGNAAG